jgi:hypothetical protein
MPITMQGSWTIQVKSCHAAYAQRFVVEGADSGNGMHEGIVGRRLFVTGRQWTLQVQHRPTRGRWHDSAQRLGLPGVDGGLLRVELGANDGGLDDHYDDLVLACSLPVSRAEHVVYGSVTSHEGELPFNPRRDDYLVIDTVADLARVLARHPSLRTVIDKLHAGRLDAVGDLTPLVVPNGLPGVAVGLLFESRPVAVDAFGADQTRAVRALQASVGRVPFRAFSMKAGIGSLSAAELDAVERIREQAIRETCATLPEPGLALRFQRYRRTPAEAAGAAYRGTGLREDLGSAITDEQGHYLFRFRHSPGDAHPDLIVQAGPAGGAPAFETAPYDRVANLRRIDVCLPRAACAASPLPQGPPERPGAVRFVEASTLRWLKPVEGVRRLKQAA